MLLLSVIGFGRNLGDIIRRGGWVGRSSGKTVDLAQARNCCEERVSKDRREVLPLGILSAPPPWQYVATQYVHECHDDNGVRTRRRI